MRGGGANEEQRVFELMSFGVMVLIASVGYWILKRVLFRVWS